MRNFFFFKKSQFCTNLYSTFPPVEHMAAVVVAIRNKRYDAEEAENSMFDSKNIVNTFPPENERRADLVMQKYMIDGYVS
jgi:hypothetical protein